MSDWWRDFFSQDVSPDSFTDDQRSLFDTYQLSQDQQRIFYSIKHGRNLFLSDKISDEELVWSIGVMGVNDRHRGDMKFYRKSEVERLQRFDEAERKYKWHSGQWTRDAMRVLVQNYSIGYMVVVPGVESSDGSPMIFTKEWYEHWPPRAEQPEGFFDYRTTTVYPLMARSICLAYPMATMKGLVSLADMRDFDHDKYDMDQKMSHSDLQAVIPNKLRRMVSVAPDDKMKQQMEDYKAIASRYGFVMYDTFAEAMEAESNLFPPDVPCFVGGTLEVDIKECLRALLRREPEALQLMEEVYEEMEESGDLLHPEHMQRKCA
mmetsp:Transcript_9662/g.30647  ORF Transcript_9662/g.30647 Transcript_9662/m.30647 type:complete len:320 (-) Transcript_9662:58-1017(-)